MDNPLRRPLDTHQRTLIEEIWKPFEEHGRWPTLGYIDHLMYRYGLDTRQVIGTLPTLSSPTSSSRYRLVINHDKLDVEVRLTVAGLYHVSAAHVVRKGFLTLVGGIAQAYYDTPASDPFDLPNYIHYQDLHEVYRLVHEVGKSRKVNTQLSRVFLKRVAEVMVREPWNEPVSVAQVMDSNKPVDPNAVLRMDSGAVAALRELRQNIGGEADYLDFLYRQFQAPAVAAVPPSAHPLDVTQAFSHLGAVWKATFGFPLLMDGDPLAFARLALPCTDDGAFNSMMSALADVMARMTVPGSEKPPQKAALERVEKFLLQAEVEDASRDRIVDAFTVLKKLRRIRVSGQHADAHHEVVELTRDLGMTWPPQDWAQSWAEAATHARGSLDILREEIQASDAAFAALL